MLEAQGFKTSSYEKFKILSVTGGIPWYLEQIQGQYSADQNIKRQCFSKGGVLVEDFDLIFHELFEKRDAVFKKIIDALNGPPIDYSEISKRTAYPKSGTLSKYLDELVQAGFIKRDYTWSLKTGKTLQLSLYRLSDNYLRFYLNYILPKRSEIADQKLQEIQLSQFPAIDSILGLQFENLVVNNRRALFKLLNIEPAAIIYDNPFFQKKTTRQKGCQVDYLIQTKNKTLYLFEVKFSRKPLGSSVIDAVKEKIARISLPRGIRVLPILIHVNGVSESIKESDYFYAVIDFCELL